MKYPSQIEFDPANTDKAVSLIREWLVTQLGFHPFSAWHMVRMTIGDSFFEMFREHNDEVVNSVYRCYYSHLGYESPPKNVIRPGCVFSLGYLGSFVAAYMSKLHPHDEWKKSGNEPGVNPFRPAIDLWELGVTPSYESETNLYHLHVGEDGQIIHSRERLKQL
jgi:hypothetical protein